MAGRFGVPVAVDPGERFSQQPHLPGMDDPLVQAAVAALAHTPPEVVARVRAALNQP
jgi:hypothetical protein